MNQFADMTDEEFAKTMLTEIPPANKASNGSLFVAKEGMEVPDTVDWRTKGYVTGVKNQGACGSCWAFSATGSLEGQHFKKTGNLVSLSEQNLVDCSTAQGNHGCQGGLMDFAFTYIKENGGIDTEASYPYVGKNGVCQFKASDVGATCTGYVDIPHEDVTALQQAVATVGPISVAMDASQTTFRFYKSGVYYDSQCSETKLDHGVLAVGYGELNSEAYWLVKNSWGTSWGDAGYFMIAQRDNDCGIATQASYPTV